MFVSLIPTFLVNLLFRSFEARDVFLDQIEEVQKKNPGRPLAFVLFSAGIVEFLALRLFLLERFGEGMELRAATRFPAIYIESFDLILKRVAAFFRLGPRPPSRIKMCSEELNAGRPIFLNFENTDRARPFEVPRGEKELAYISQQNSNTLIVPVVFVWRRSGRIETGSSSLKQISNKILFSPWTFFVGDPYQPTGIRKIFIMLRGYARSTLRVSGHFEVSEYQPRILRRKVILSMLQEKKVILGPTYLATKLVGENILRNASFVRLVSKLASDENVSEIQILKRAQKMFFEISSLYTYFVVEVAAWVLDKVFNTIFEGIDLDPEDLKKLRERAREGSLVYVPSHKSYVDFLVLSYVLFRNDMAPPHIVAGINMNFWPIGSFFRRSGAFFIRRSFRGNILYSEVLRRYIAALLDNGVSVEFFIEGARSRNGKLSAPKYGMLKMIVDSSIEELIKPKLRFVPVSIVYDRVTETHSHKRELEGGEKVQESALGAMKATKVLFKRYGKVHLRFSEPVALEEWVQQQMGEGTHSLDTRKLAVQKLAFEICHRINQRTLLTAVGLNSALLLSKPESTISKQELEMWFERLHEDLKVLQAPLSPDLEKDFSRAMRRGTARLMDDKIFERVHLPDKKTVLKIPNKQRIAALYYKNTAVHPFVIPAIAGLAHGNIEECLELRNLLQFEYFFPEKDTFLREVSALPTGIMKELYALMLEDVLENIGLGLSGLSQMQGLFLDEKEWRNRLMKFGRSALSARLTSRGEAVNTQSFYAFIQMARNRGWLKKTPSQNQLLTPASPGELQPTIRRLLYFKNKLKPWPLIRSRYLAYAE